MTIESTNDKQQTVPAITYSECYVQPFFTFYNADNMEIMKQYPDKHFDLAIVDPPYGIGASDVKFINGTSKTDKPYYKLNCWDKQRPTEQYFCELKRVSKNQIIWGGNYFADILGQFRCYIFWDKTIHGNSYADGEMAWTSFDKVARYYRKNIAQVNSEGRIHPTQKPIQLYEYLLNNYANENDKIIDTHLGSGSIAIAIDKANTLDKKNLTFVGIELDPDYYRAAVERFKNHKRQLVLF